MIGTYPEDTYVVYVDDDEADAPARVITAAEIASIDRRIKAAVTGGTFGDAFAPNNEVDDGSRRRRDVRADADSGELVDKVLKHFDDAMKAFTTGINKRMDDLEQRYEKRVRLRPCLRA
jgi:hypothetical protein